MTRSTLPKVLLVFTTLCLTACILFGQKTEIKANVYNGLFSFRGNGSTSASSGYLNPSGFYGRKPGFSYSFELQAQQVTRKNHLFGLGISFERLTSSTPTTLYVTDIVDGMDPGPTEIGKTTLHNSFITINPFIGQRFFSNRTITLDVLAGLDLARFLKSSVRIKMFNTPRNDYYAFSKNDVTPSTDTRARAQISANYKQFSLLAGYSLGLTNYQTRTDTKAYSRFFRIGIGYRLK